MAVSVRVAATPRIGPFQSNLGRLVGSLSVGGARAYGPVIALAHGTDSPGREVTLGQSSHARELASPVLPAQESVRAKGCAGHQRHVPPWPRAHSRG